MELTQILVCGGTGVLGQYFVPLLVAQGHVVTGLARSASAAERIAAWGARPAPGDVFDSAALAIAVRGHEVVIHAATRIPRVFPGRPSDFAENDRIRREGTRRLVEAVGAPLSDFPRWLPRVPSDLRAAVHVGPSEESGR